MGDTGRSIKYITEQPREYFYISDVLYFDFHIRHHLSNWEVTRMKRGLLQPCSKQTTSCDHEAALKAAQSDVHTEL